jgi:hypothetical protein
MVDCEGRADKKVGTPFSNLLLALGGRYAESIPAFPALRESSSLSNSVLEFSSMLVNGIFGVDIHTRMYKRALAWWGRRHYHASTFLLGDCDDIILLFV